MPLFWYKQGVNCVFFRQHIYLDEGGIMWMKTIEDYLKLPYRLEIIPDIEEGGYVVTYPELPGCISIGEDIQDAIENAQDAKRVWLEAAIEDGVEIYEPSLVEDYSGQFKLRIPKSLHKILAENARREGTSMNQYCLYLLAMNNAVYQSKGK